MSRRTVNLLFKILATDNLQSVFIVHFNFACSLMVKLFVQSIRVNGRKVDLRHCALLTATVVIKLRECFGYSCLLERQLFKHQMKPHYFPWASTLSSFLLAPSNYYSLLSHFQSCTRTPITVHPHFDLHHQYKFSSPHHHLPLQLLTLRHLHHSNWSQRLIVSLSSLLLLLNFANLTNFVDFVNFVTIFAKQVVAVARQQLSPYQVAFFAFTRRVLLKIQTNVSNYESCFTLLHQVSYHFHLLNGH